MFRRSAPHEQRTLRPHRTHRTPMRIARGCAGVALTCVLSVGYATAATAGSTAEAMAADAATAARLQAHQQARAALSSVQVDVVTVTHGPLRRTVGRVVLRGAEAYYRVSEQTETGERVVQESTVTPTEQQTINYEARVATRVDVARLHATAPALQVPNNARDVLDAFARAAPGTVQYLGPAVLENVTLDRFRIAATLGDEPAGVLLVWVHPGDGLPRRMELRSPNDRPLLEREFVNVKVNAVIPDDLFTLRVPADIPVRDVTDEYLPAPR